MKKLLIILMVALFGCTESPAPKQDFNTETTHIKRKKKRYICSNKTTVVAVIDTGFRFGPDSSDVMLCQYGHKDFTSIQIYNNRHTKTPVPVDTHGHGTNVAGLIQKYAGNTNFCMVIIKYFNFKATDQENFKSSTEAIKYATNIKADYINYSGGGQLSDQSENAAVRAYLNQGGKFIAAAGNEGNNIEFAPYYPAMTDPRVISVGSLNNKGIRLQSSNYGPSVKRWEVGIEQKAFGITMTGTSQATAIATGKLVKEECAK